MNVRLSQRSIPADMVLPARTCTGPDVLAQLPAIGQAFGQRGMIVYGRALAESGQLDALQRGADILPWRYRGGEPELETVEQLLSVARSHGADWIAGIGGGSILDAAKVVAGLFQAGASVADYHHGTPIEGGGLPFLAVPTTAGSGSDATMVAVLSDPEKQQKRSIRHPHFVARAVLLDPTLLASCPHVVIAHSGMDALTQAIESFVSRYATVFTDAAALEAIRLVCAHLPALHADPSNTQAAEAMLTASFLAGIALSGARLGIVHGLAHPVGWHSGLPHGQVCAMCLPLALAFNRPAAQQRFAVLDAMLDGSVDAYVARLMDRFAIMPHTGQALPAEAGAMLEDVLASGSTAANPRQVEPAHVWELLHALYPA